METLSDMYIFNFSFWMRFGAAVLCGFIVGWERERSHKPAGLRTTILICLGSCIFVMSQEMIARLGYGVMDPSRIAGQIVTGVGFLGAGAILHQGVTVTGLTTAATIWLIAAIGVLIGVGYVYTAVAVTVCTMLILQPLRWLERTEIFRNGNNCDKLRRNDDPK